MSDVIDGWEKCDGRDDGDQMVGGRWYRPKFGCDSLEIAFDAALLEGVKAGIEAAAKASGKGMARANIYALDPAAIARQVREGKR